jgi:hypothetical protein
MADKSPANQLSQLLTGMETDRQTQAMACLLYRIQLYDAIESAQNTAQCHQNTHYIIIPHFDINLLLSQPSCARIFTIVVHLYLDLTTL